MFYPQKMQRIRLAVHESVRDRAVKRLHELGAVQISDFREQFDQEAWAALLRAHPASTDTRQVTTQLMTCNRLLDVFSMVAPEPEEGFFKTLFAPAPPVTIPVEDLTGPALFEEVRTCVAGAEDEISEPLEQLEQCQAEKDALASQRAAYAAIQGIDIPLETIGSGPFVTVVPGIAPAGDFQALGQELEQLADGRVFFGAAPVSETGACCVLVVCLNEHADSVAACLRRADVERIPPGEFTGGPAGAIAEIDRRIAGLESRQQECRSAISASATRWRDRLKALRELLLIERERVEAHTSFAATDHVVAIQGFVPQKQAAAVSGELQRSCDGLVVCEISEPDVPPDDLPVALDNPGVLKHFELLVKLYAPPRYDEIDPTVLIFPSFLFFFGLMITDAMYGLMCLVLGLCVLRGGGRYYPLYRSAGLLLSLGGAATVVLGSMTGGWFGNLATEYLGLTFLNSLVVINPMVDVSNFLVFSIGVGLLHLNLGIVVGIIKDVRRNSIPDALKNVWIFFLEAAIICWYVGAATPALVFAVPAVLLLLYAEKGMALFGVTGLLGDSLSYARLMALGLVSFGLAVAINALAKMVWGISYVGWAIALAILVAGHVFSFVLNLMGAFAHGIRLHFVEFFGKFYDGGGEEFTPFCVKRELTRLK